MVVFNAIGKVLVEPANSISRIILMNRNEALLEQLRDNYLQAKDLGLIKTSRAIADAVRLIHWESAALIPDTGMPHRRRSTDYDRDITVLHTDDEVLI